MQDTKKMLLIFNPKAGQQLFIRNLYEVLDRLTAAGFVVTVYPTQGKGDAHRVALRDGSGYDYVVCSGGDGTFSEVADAIMRFERKPLLGYIPAGTANDFANTMGLPTDMLDAADTLCTGKPEKIDVGSFGSRYFSYVAAFGLFTDVSYGTPQDMKNLLGHAAYMLEGVRRLANIKSWRLSVNCDGEEINDDFILGMVTNSLSVGGLRLIKVSEPEDGHFKLILLRRINRFSQLQEVLSSIAEGSLTGSRFIVRSVRNLTIKSDNRLEWSLDGEYGGNFRDVGVSIVPGALSLIVPRNDYKVSHVLL